MTQQLLADYKKIPKVKKQGGKHGSLLPASHILENGKEMYQGLLSFAENLSVEYDRRKKLGPKRWRTGWERESHRESFQTHDVGTSQQLADLSADLAMLE